MKLVEYDYWDYSCLGKADKKGLYLKQNKRQDWNQCINKRNYSQQSGSKPQSEAKSLF